MSLRPGNERIAYTIPIGDRLTGVNYEYVEITLVNNTAFSHRWVVPAAQQWFVDGVTADNADNVARQIEVTVRDTTAHNLYRLIGRYDSVGAGGVVVIPFSSGGNASVNYPVKVERGYEVQITWAAGGASAGGTSRTTLDARAIADS